MIKANNNNYVEEDEIDLKELFKTIWDKKFFIIIFTIIITITAGIYAYTKTPIYEVKSYIELGYINKESIENIDSLEQKTKVIFLVNDRKNEENSFEKGVVSSINQVKGVKNFLEIKTEGFSNETALIKNKEVLKFIQELSAEKLKEHEFILNNSILNTQREIDFINNIEMKNISSQIKILKEQEIISIDNQINLLKSQEIPILEKNIEFLINTKIKSLEDKIDYYSISLEKYVSEVNKLNKNITRVENTSSIIVSIQILNYQNLITNAQNQIRDLELQVEIIRNETIPKLKYNLENIITIQIKDLENKKANVSNDTIRKLEDKINIELQTKISQLSEKVDIKKLQNSEQNIANAKLIGEYIVKNYPVKPKKSLIIVISFVTGFILSIFLTFFLHFIRKN